MKKAKAILGGFAIVLLVADIAAYLLVAKPAGVSPGGVFTNFVERVGGE